MAVLPFERGQTYTPPPNMKTHQINGDVSVTVSGDEGPVSFDPQTNTTQIKLDDGSVDISFGNTEPSARETSSFDDNIAEQLTDAELSAIAEKLLMGIDQDVQSRAAWLENTTTGISLLGLEIKTPRGGTASGGSPAEGISTVDHPLLLEAVLRFQANARGELLPTDGPVKVRNDGEGNEVADKLAEALQKDLNHYLTKVATEYYPDTDRMLLMLGFSGISFKKGRHDPIKRRPVIESIDAKDLIVSNAATCLEDAGRVTHRIMMRHSTMRRMQLCGAYRDIPLHSPGTTILKNPVDTKIDAIQGISPPTFVDPQDQDRELYECYCEIEVPGFEHKKEGKLTGLPLPYKVTLDKEARHILEIRRNWDEEDPFMMPRNRIIAYIFIPGLGLYGIGLLNVLGNSTKAVTAAWRLMLDGGMFSNFPGFLYLKSLGKQLTNQFRIPPGGGMAIDTVGNDIRASVMPLPYKDPSAVFIQLIENISTAAQRVGGTAETQIGEGKQDAPVGTTLAIIEQATKMMSAVHKRLHQAQGQEFDMLKSLLMEDPEALWRHNKKSKVLKLLKLMGPEAQALVNAEDGAELRHQQLFLAALADIELVPMADPNTSSSTERYLKCVAMRQMAQTNPSLDMDAIDRRCFSTMGVDDADSLFKPPPPPGSVPPNPENTSAQASMITAQAKVQESQTSAQIATAKIQQDQQSSQVDAQIQQQKLASQERIANLQVAREMVIHNQDVAQEQQSQQSDQQHDQQIQGVENQQSALDRAHEMAVTNVQNQAKGSQAKADRTHDLITGVADRHHEANMTGVAQQHEAVQGGLDRQHEATQNQMDRQHEIAMPPPPAPPKGGVA